jgi:hypothetical protein
VQPTTADSYRSITHTPTVKGAEFHTFKPNEERNYRVILKHMHYSVNPDDIKSEIEKLAHKVANIWNIKQFQTKLPLSMFFVDLKSAPNNKDILYLMLNSFNNAKLNLNHQSTNEIAQCLNCQRYGHTKNYCHLRPRCVKYASDHLTLHCQCKDRSSSVRCDGNHPSNYKGCTVYKDLQRKTYPSLRPKQYTPPALIQQTSHTQPGVSYAEIISKNLPPTPTPAPTPPTNLPLQQFNAISHLKTLMTSLFEQMGTMMNLLLHCPYQAQIMATLLQLAL